jgi:hypothetical protein
MTDDTRLLALLRSAVPPVVTAEPSANMWPRVLRRSRERPKWLWLDVGLGAGVVIALVMRPELLMLLAYYF